MPHWRPEPLTNQVPAHCCSSWTVPKRAQCGRYRTDAPKKHEPKTYRIIPLGTNLFPRLFLTKVGRKRILVFFGGWKGYVYCFDRESEWCQLSQPSSNFFFFLEFSTSGIFQICMRPKLDWSLGKIQLFIKSNRKDQCHHLDARYWVWQCIV